MEIIFIWPLKKLVWSCLCSFLYASMKSCTQQLIQWIRLWSHHLRYFNEMSAQGLRARTVSSPIPYTPSPSSSRPISPGRYNTIYSTFDLCCYDFILHPSFAFVPEHYMNIYLVFKYWGTVISKLTPLLTQHVVLILNSHFNWLFCWVTL